MKYFIIVGERSGDLHAANLIRSIKQHDNHANIVGYAGECCQEMGAKIIKHYAEISFMGLWEVIINLWNIRKILKQCKTDILEFKPDAIVLVDFGGFNMQIARFAKLNNFRTFYYIAPKVWAWNQGRAWKIKKYVDTLLVILSFEVDFFKKYNYNAIYVGNPLMDSVANFTKNQDFKNTNGLETKKIIALLPGSRQQEIAQILPLMAAATRYFPSYTFVVGKVCNLPNQLYDNILGQYPQIKTVTDQAYDLLAVADAALVTSGTATLETALFDVPQVVCYRTSWLTYWVAKMVLKIPYISLVNLVANKAVAKELIQYDLTALNLSNELEKILENPVIIKTDYAEIRRRVGESGASERAGLLIVSQLKTLYHFNNNQQF